MGGVAGHMAHLSEDTELTFNEIVDILGKVANAEIDNATEKVDGQNLFLTVDSSGEIKTYRQHCVSLLEKIQRPSLQMASATLIWR